MLMVRTKHMRCGDGARRRRVRAVAVANAQQCCDGRSGRLAEFIIGVIRRTGECRKVSEAHDAGCVEWKWVNETVESSWQRAVLTANG